MSNVLVVLDQPSFNKTEIRSESALVKAIFAGDIHEDNEKVRELDGYTFNTILVPATITEDVPCYTSVQNLIARLSSDNENVWVTQYVGTY